jgi:NitT/TauT family transport system permease protein
MATDWADPPPSASHYAEDHLLALAIALVGGVAMAVLMAQSRWIELALYPYAVILQVTPVVAIAPLIIIYAPDDSNGAADLRWLVAFFRCCPTPARASEHRP